MGQRQQLYTAEQVQQLIAWFNGDVADHGLDLAGMPRPASKQRSADAVMVH